MSNSSPIEPAAEPVATGPPPPPRIRPPRPIATLQIVLANVLVFLVPFALDVIPWSSAHLLDHPLAVEMGAAVGGGRSFTEPWRLITANFLHAGAIHLGCNMLSLWSVGRWVEAFVGPRRLLIVYAVSAVGSVMISSAAGGAGRVSLGASGAVLGVAWGVLVLLYRIRRSLPPGVAKRAMIQLTLMLSIPLVLLPIWFPVDNWGHAGGSVIGAVAVALLPLGPETAPRWWRITTWVPLIAFLIIGLSVPPYLALRTLTAETRLDGKDTVETVRVTVAVDSTWDRGELSDGVEWTQTGRPRARLRWFDDRFTPLYQVDALERELEREVELGTIDGFTIAYKEDRIGDGVGGIVVAYALEFPGDGISGLFTGRTAQRQIHVHRFFDTPRGSAMLAFYGRDSDWDMKLGLEFIDSVVPVR